MFNWYCATSFGTGMYMVGETSVTVSAPPLGYTLVETDDSLWGLRLTRPTSAARCSFDFYDPDRRQIDDINLTALSIVPGVEHIIPIEPN